ncbi:MAG TPA: ATP-binding protein, partial [Candidatus Nitrosotenuis sp.]|nr:ATP-binding protein [Candidatus Nitrosotenuis sp.]
MTLRVLVVGSGAEAQPVVGELEKQGPVHWRLVDTPEGFLKSLEESWDAVLADYEVSGFGALAALELLQARELDVPLLVVAGAIGEERVAECLRRGGADYVSRGHLERLPAALQAALEAARLRREHRRAQEELEATQGSVRHFRLLLDHLPQAVWLARGQKAFYVSPAWARIWGRPLESACGEPAGWLEGVHPEDRQRFLLEVQDPGPLVPHQHEFRVVHPDGSVRWVRCQVVLLEQGEEPLVGGFTEDITERRRVEEQLLQAQKMEALGRLAAGVAHDFNNLLTVILGSVEMARADLPAGHRLAEELAEIGRAAGRGRDLIRQLLAFSRQQTLRPRLLDLNALVLGMERMLGRLLGEDITIEKSLQADLPPVYADAGQLEQAIANLAVNARDAMPSGGRLTLETAEVELGPSQPDGLPAGRYVRLAVTDTGTGMDEETRSRIFEPFFTTKEPGQGTGLGLSTVLGIVSQSGGGVRVYSEPGRGSCFKIYLPAATGPVQEAPAPAPAAGALSPGSGAVLVVEDDASVRHLATRILARAGYQVIPAGSPREALEFSRSAARPPDLLLSDLVLPEM